MCDLCKIWIKKRNGNSGMRDHHWKDLERHMDEYHATLAQGLDIKKDWKSHYEMGTPFLEKRI